MAQTKISLGLTHSIAYLQSSEKQDNNVNICSENTNSRKHMSATQKTAFTTTVKASLQEEVLFPRHVLIAAVFQYVCLDCRHYRKTGKM